MSEYAKMDSREVGYHAGIDVLNRGDCGPGFLAVMVRERAAIEAHYGREFCEDSFRAGVMDGFRMAKKAKGGV